MVELKDSLTAAAGDCQMMTRRCIVARSLDHPPSTMKHSLFAATYYFTTAWDDLEEHVNTTPSYLRAEVTRKKKIFIASNLFDHLH